MYCFYYTRKNSPPQIYLGFPHPRTFSAPYFKSRKPAQVSIISHSVSEGWAADVSHTTENFFQSLNCKITNSTGDSPCSYSPFLPSLVMQTSCLSSLPSFLLSCYRAHFAVRTKLIVFALIGYKHILSLSVWVTALNLPQRKLNIKWGLETALKVCHKSAVTLQTFLEMIRTFISVYF